MTKGLEEQAWVVRFLDGTEKRPGYMALAGHPQATPSSAWVCEEQNRRCRTVPSAVLVTPPSQEPSCLLAWAHAHLSINETVPQETAVDTLETGAQTCLWVHMRVRERDAKVSWQHGCSLQQVWVISAELKSWTVHEGGLGNSGDRKSRDLASHPAFSGNFLCPMPGLASSPGQVQGRLCFLRLPSPRAETLWP